MHGNRFHEAMAVAMLFTIGVLVVSGSDSRAPWARQPAALDSQVTLTNITHSQPLSPRAMVLHDDNQSDWDAGTPAFVALEVLAESGSPTDLIATADADPDVLVTASGVGAVLPGDSDRVDLSVSTDRYNRLALATMLVNTNDAFSGISGVSLDNWPWFCRAPS